MKDKWLDDIQKRMTDFETEEPDMLWHDLCEARRPRHHVFVWRKVASAAASILVLLSLGLYIFLKPDVSLDMQEEMTAGLFSETPDTQKKEEHSADIITASTLLSDHSPAISQSNIISVPKEDSATSDSESTLVLASDYTLVNRTTDSKQIKEAATPERELKHNEQRYVAPVTAKMTGMRRLSFSLFANSIPGRASDRYHGRFGPMSDPMNSQGWFGSQMVNLLNHNRKSNAEEEVKHHLPIRAGISAEYGLNDRVSLTAGVSYTCLSSEISDSGETPEYNADQTLHFIGIGLGAKYKLATWKVVDVYVAAGVMTEKCVSGTYSCHNLIDYGVSSTETESVMVRPLQWSANASAGLQYNISDKVGLYVEPGISYYFDNGSDVRTIYKDKALNFNFNLGLRFTFGH